ncbi:MAG: hypothetical protein IPF96_04555 [Rhodobacter sp.]|nr:hypothetical protein [Rhodobacter sp.]
MDCTVGATFCAHRAFLSEFYEGGFPGTFARGALFQVNEATGDKRISGSFASLTGLEAALEAGDPAAADLAVQRMLMGHALIASFGGIPLIYMGDELALLNDRSYVGDLAHAHDSRWIHRPMMDWDRAATRHSGSDAAAVVFRGTRAILARRRAVPGLHGGVPTQILRAEAAGVFGFRRDAPTGAILCLFNFTEGWQHLPEGWLRAEGASRMHDLLSDQPVQLHAGDLALPPYARVWLT